MVTSFCSIHAIIYRIQNDTKMPDKRCGVYIFILLALYFCNQEKKSI